ncbi:hypothetical protein BJ971_001512 [Actinoplanes digitatis]|uniref:Uncharacterized protein n=1 Tax=Actinoplanes digitatis TaxID=1868 RepID=A0A7W7MNG3_9ACTN|nr:hypothetical protein [Actinoplanes digitatis]
MTTDATTARSGSAQSAAAAPPARGQQIVTQRLVQVLAGESFYKPAQHHQTHAGVAERRAGHSTLDQWRGQHRLPAGRVVGQAGDLGTDRQRRRMGQQHGDGDGALSGAGELGQVLPQRLVKLDLALVDELQHQQRGVDLGQ